jgi:hypothetical protein
VHHTVDPLGESWFVEALTDQRDHDASAIIREMDDDGRMEEWFLHRRSRWKLQHDHSRLEADSICV